MDKEDGSAPFLAGLVFGALAGTAVAFLTARRSGAQVRQELCERAQELQSRTAAESVAPHCVGCPVVAGVRSLLALARDSFREALEEGRRAAEERRQALRAELEQAQRAAHSGTSVPDEIELT